MANARREPYACVYSAVLMPEKNNEWSEHWKGIWSLKYLWDANCLFSPDFINSECWFSSGNDISSDNAGKLGIDISDN